MIYLHTHTHADALKTSSHKAFAKARPIPPIVRSARRCLQMLRSEMDMINMVHKF